VTNGAPGRVAVLGFGNVLMEDDALGPYAVRLFEARYELPEQVAVVDIGTPGLDLVPYIEEVDALVLVDTVRSHAPPGTLRLYRRDDILKHPPQPRVSPHDPGLKQTLLSLEFAGHGPRDVLLVGVVPQRTGQGVGMSDPVRAALPAVHAEILRELERLGVPAIPRRAPLAPDIWWERRP
jgi:hydrogenase maturation protease